MLNQLVQGCNIIEINRKNLEGSKIDFNSLIPQTDDLTEEEVEKVLEVSEKQRDSQGMDSIPIEVYNAMLAYCLDHRDFRTALWLVIMANTGLRYKDSVKFRRIDFIDENNRIRNSILRTEQKTGKQRVIFINDAMKMALLMHLWNGDYKPLDYLIVAEGKFKGYEMETYIDEYGRTKVVRKNGKYVYRLDENGNKIPKPLSISQSTVILKKLMVNALGINIKNERSCRNKDDALLKICTHSLRKCYSDAVIKTFSEIYDGQEAYTKAAAMEQLRYDLNHSSVAMGYHYVKDYEKTKKEINLRMNLGIEVLEKYFEAEKTKYLHKSALD